MGYSLQKEFSKTPGFFIFYIYILTSRKKPEKDNEQFLRSEFYGQIKGWTFKKLNLKAPLSETMGQKRQNLTNIDPISMKQEYF